MSRSDGRSASSGFTLIELAAVLAIIAILAGVSLGTYQAYIRQARTAEAEAHVYTLASLLTGQPEGPRPCPATPAEVPSAGQVPWPEAPCYDALGFRPGTATRFQYEVVVPAPNGSAFLVRARGDQDGDGTTSLFELSADTNELHVERGIE